MAEEENKEEQKKIRSIDEFGHVVYVSTNPVTSLFITYMPPAPGVAGRIGFITATPVPGEEEKPPEERKCSAIIHMVPVEKADYIATVIREMVKSNVSESIAVMESVKFNLQHQHDDEEDISCQ